MLPTSRDRADENSFLFADADEAFVLETAGARHWAAERIAPGGARNLFAGAELNLLRDVPFVGLKMVVFEALCAAYRHSAWARAMGAHVVLGGTGIACSAGAAGGRQADVAVHTRTRTAV